MLQKLCNHPDLVNLERDLPGSEKLFPEGYTQFGRKREVWPALSGKMLVLERYARFIDMHFVYKMLTPLWQIPGQDESRVR